MAFFELNDIKRDRVPYTSDKIWHCKIIFKFSAFMVSFYNKYDRKELENSHRRNFNGNCSGRTSQPLLDLNEDSKFGVRMAQELSSMEYLFKRGF